MFLNRIKSKLPLLCLLTLISAQRDPFRGFNWQQYRMQRWRDPIFVFGSRRLIPFIRTTPSYEELDTPRIIYMPRPVDSVYDSGSIEDEQILSNELPYKTDNDREFNVTVERFGGFGGSGDIRGYGAYEYKQPETSAYEYKRPETNAYEYKQPEMNAYEYNQPETGTYEYKARDKRRPVLFPDVIRIENQQIPYLDSIFKLDSLKK